MPNVLIMEFRLEFTPKSFEEKINHKHKLFLAGSCFTEQIGAKLSHYKFQTIDNPHGILFNPISIANAISSYIENKKYTESDLFLHHELWGSWDHHTKFSSIQKEDCLHKINASQETAHQFLKETDWLLLTLGSAFVYELHDKKVVANCHKVPTDKFNKRLLSAEEIKSTLSNLVDQLLHFNPRIKIIFTISPVRHLRDGFIENNRSKAHLISAVHELIAEQSSAFYFPAYELVIDDLRDYRFYAEDMVHPNYSATNYVWEKFMATCIDDSSQLLMKEIGTIRAAKNHKPFNPLSAQHQKFLEVNLDKALHLKNRYPYIDFSEEIDFFKAFL